MCVLCVVGMCVWLRKIKTKNGENSSSSKFSFQVVVVKNYASSVRCVCVLLLLLNSSSLLLAKYGTRQNYCFVSVLYMLVRVEQSIKRESWIQKT